MIDIRESAIHGRGVFAARFIPAGTRLGTYRGARVTDDAADGPYVLWVWNEDDTMVGIDGENDLRYVNHSTDPNVEFVGPELSALRDIEPGEELTHNYGEDWA
jgi:SET domain-containing protein